MQVAEALATLKASLSAPAQDPQYEGLVAGRPDIEVQGVTTCFAPSVKALRQAVDEGCNLVIADAHPFHTYDPQWGGTSVRSVVDPSPVGLAKQKIIDDNGIAVVRFRTAWAARYPAGAAMALASAWGFEEARVPSPASDFVVADMQASEFDALARSLSERNGCVGIRLIGRPDLSVRRIAIGTGLLSPAALGQMLADPAVDAVIGGEVVEWEGAPYFEDVIASGRDAGLILTGFAVSREPLAGALADWVRDALPGMAVVQVAEKDPVRSVANGGDA